MEYTKVGLTKADIKKLYENNQILKKLFEHYWITEGGLIVCEPDLAVPKLGFHAAKSEDMKELREIVSPEKDIRLDSDAVYRFINTKKRTKIVDAVINGSDVYLMADDEEVCKIGSFAKPVGKKDMIDYARRRFTVSNLRGIDLGSDTVCNLMDDAVELKSDGPFRMRLSKELFPVLKEDSNASFKFIPREEEGLFEAILSSSRSGIVSWHMYTCVQF